MIKFMNGREVSPKNCVKVRSLPGATIDNFIMSNPLFEKKPNLIGK